MGGRTRRPEPRPGSFPPSPPSPPRLGERGEAALPWAPPPGRRPPRARSPRRGRRGDGAASATRAESGGCGLTAGLAPGATTGGGVLRRGTRGPLQAGRLRGPAGLRGCPSSGPAQLPGNAAGRPATAATCGDALPPGGRREAAASCSPTGPGGKPRAHGRADTHRRRTHTSRQDSFWGFIRGPRVGSCGADRGYPSASLLRRGGPHSAVSAVRRLQPGKRGGGDARQRCLRRGNRTPLLSAATARGAGARRPRSSPGSSRPALRPGPPRLPAAPQTRLRPSLYVFLRVRQRAGGRASRGRRGGSSRRGLRTPGPRSRPQPRQRLHGPSATDPSAVLSLRPRPGLFPPASRAARRRSPPHRAARDPSFRPRPPACPFQPRGRFPGTSRPPAARWRP